MILPLVFDAGTSDEAPHINQSLLPGSGLLVFTRREAYDELGFRGKIRRKINPLAQREAPSFD